MTGTAGQIPDLPKEIVDRWMNENGYPCGALKNVMNAPRPLTPLARHGRYGSRNRGGIFATMRHNRKGEILIYEL